MQTHRGYLGGLFAKLSLMESLSTRLRASTTQLRVIVFTSFLAVLIFWNLSWVDLPKYSGKKLYSKIDMDIQYEQDLLSPEFIGLSPHFVQYDLTNDQIRSNLTDLPISNRTVELDFRRISIAGRDHPVGREYQGFSCLAHYPGAHCPLPGQCPPAHADSLGAESVSTNGPCLHWGTGTLPYSLQPPAWPDISEARSSLQLESDWDCDGTWTGDRWLPNVPVGRNDGRKVDRAAQPRPYRFFTPKDMHTCLIGKRIFIQGDSMMRQLFHRIIHYSRGIPSSAEKYYQGMMSMYTVFANGTDSWALPLVGNASDITREQDEIEGVLFRVFFDFQGRIDESNDIYSNLQKLVSLDADAAIVGMNYWYPHSYDFSRLPEVLDRFLVDSSWPGIMSWYSTPQEYGTQDNWWHVGQSALMRTYTTDRRLREGRRLHTLPVDRMVIRADERGAPQRNCGIHAWPSTECVHDAHFGCGILDQWELPTRAGLEGFKAPYGYDCRDMFNLNVLQVWLNSICAP